MAILVGSPETCSELAVLMIRDLQKFCRSFPLFARILLLLFDVSIPHKNRRTKKRGIKEIGKI